MAKPLPVSRSSPENEARHALRSVLEFAHRNTYTTPGNAWRQFVASLAFETKADLSLIRDLEEHDQARFLSITAAYMSRELDPDEVRDVYLEFFPRPQLDAGDWLRDV
jgi:hypothetical protein